MFIPESLLNYLKNKNKSSMKLGVQPNPVVLEPTNNRTIQPIEPWVPSGGTPLGQLYPNMRSRVPSGGTPFEPWVPSGGTPLGQLYPNMRSIVAGDLARNMLAGEGVSQRISPMVGGLQSAGFSRALAPNNVGGMGSAIGNAMNNVATPRNITKKPLKMGNIFSGYFGG